MQTLLFSHLLELRPQISFPCTVNGKDLTATLTHKEATGLQTLYHVQFSDGHRDAYVAGDNELRDGIVRTRTLDIYEEAVLDDLCVAHHMEKGSWFINVRICEVGGESFNAWIMEKNGHYSICYKGKYQFTLRKKERWESGTMRENGYVVNGRLAKLLADYLDEYALKETRQLKIA